MRLGGLLLGALSLAVVTAPAFAQSRTKPDDDALLQGRGQGQEQDQEQQPQGLPDAHLLDPSARGAEVAESAVGRAGQRQTREDVAPKTNLNPMRRISNRVENRIRSRFHNRIDRDYDPQADAASPFETAEDEARTTAR